MATLAPISSPARTPFASLGAGRLRSLTNVKNRQNAFVTTPLKPGTKRSHSPDTFEDNDAENIDPGLLSSKKAKSDTSEPIKSSLVRKPQHFVLKSAASAPSISARPTITPRSIRSLRSLDARPAPSSAPAAAGRSPKSKRAGIFSTRRISAGYSRIDPPAFSLGHNNGSVGLPFSIDAALSGSVPSYKPLAPAPATVPTPAPNTVEFEPIRTLDEPPMPASWMFDIHEDTPEDELNNVMSFSTQTLDISDDEGKKLSERSDRGKENIPPPELSQASAPATRKDLMTDAPRSPLGELEAKEYYAEGCDANSFVIVPGEKDDEKVTVYDVAEAPRADAFEPALVSPTENTLCWKNLMASSERHADKEAEKGEDAPIEIWESESAKGDEETEVKILGQTTPLESGSPLLGHIEAVGVEEGFSL